MTINADDVFSRLRDILCEILVLNPEDIQPSSKLVDDLDADSIAFVELIWHIGTDFGLEVPETKVDEEMLTMPLVEGMETLEQTMGGTTLFEFMKQEVSEADDDSPIAAWKVINEDEEARAEAAQMPVSSLAEQMGCSVPPDYDPDASVSTLQLRDLFSFITVDSYVQYILYLHEAQERINAAGGAQAMFDEVIEKTSEQSKP